MLIFSSYIFMITQLVITPTIVIPMDTSPFSVSECESGWHRYDSKCYKYHHDQAGANFHDAFAICEYAYHATLVTIHSEEEFNFISKLIFEDHHAKYSIWIGLIRISNTSFVWFDRSELNYTNWGPNEPNNWQSKNYCAVMSSSPTVRGKWFDVSCSTAYLVMCQKYLQEVFTPNQTYSEISIGDEISIKSDQIFNSAENIGDNYSIDRNELSHIKILGNVNIVLTTIIFIIIFIFVLTNYSFVSFRLNRSFNHFSSFRNSIERSNSIDV